MTQAQNTPFPLWVKVLKNRSYGYLAGGASLHFPSSTTIRFTPKPPRALRTYQRNDLWWAVEFDCEYLGDYESTLRGNIEVWMEKNCLAGTTHLPRHTNYAGFRKEEDALMCYLAFC